MQYSPAEIKKGTVFLVEDNGFARSSIKDMLEHLEYSVIEAVDGNHALRKFRENQNEIDLILLDVIMPGKNGKQVAEEVRRIVPDITIVFMSGYTDGHFSGEEIAKEHFIPKPFSLNDLSKKISGALYPFRNM